MSKEFIPAVWVTWNYNIFKWVVPEIAINNINYNLLFYTVLEANSRMLAKFTFMLCGIYAKQEGIIGKLFSLT